VSRDGARNFVIGRLILRSADEGCDSLFEAAMFVPTSATIWTVQEHQP
jgi:hypothetical protein